VCVRACVRACVCAYAHPCVRIRCAFGRCDARQGSCFLEVAGRAAQRIPIAPEWCPDAPLRVVTLGVAEGQFELSAKHLRIELARRAAPPTVTNASGLRAITTPQLNPPSRLDTRALVLSSSTDPMAELSNIDPSSRVTWPFTLALTLPILPLQSGSFHSPQSTRLRVPVITLTRAGSARLRQSTHGYSRPLQSGSFHSPQSTRRGPSLSSTARAPF
jgi:hypothetical protein